MIIEREKVYTRKRSIHTETIHRKSWWLFGIIPLFINNKIIDRRLF